MNHTYHFCNNAVIINGKSFDAEYSISPKTGNVAAFVTVNDGKKVRIVIEPEKPEFEGARAAACRESVELLQKIPDGWKISEGALAPRGFVWINNGKSHFGGEYVAALAPEAAAKTQPEATEPVEIAPHIVEQTEQEPPAVSIKERPEIIPEPEAKSENVRAFDESEPHAATVEERHKIIPEPEATEHPAEDRRAEIPEKTFIGECITGAGWCIVFDKALNRTRVIFKNAPDAARAVILAAGFYYSYKTDSYNKKLTHRAHRAAEALARQLAAVC